MSVGYFPGGKSAADTTATVPFAISSWCAPITASVASSSTVSFSYLFLQIYLFVFRARGIADRLHAGDIGIRDVRQILNLFAV